MQHHYSSEQKMTMLSYALYYVKTKQISTKKENMVQCHFHMKHTKFMLTYTFWYILENIAAANKKYKCGATPVLVAAQ